MHWRHLPVALYPTPGTADEDGCWSGCAVVKDGRPAFIYTGVRGGVQLPCMARSADQHLIRWEKYSYNPIIASPPAGYDLTGFRDHSVWRENGEWRMVIGSGVKGVGGAVFLYRSADLLNWQYMHPLLMGDLSHEDGCYTATEWECPDFFRLEDCHFLVLSVMEMIHRKVVPFYSLYFSGTYRQGHFEPHTKAKLDYGDIAFYAPQSMLDEQGRRLMWGWVMEERPQQESNEAGWAGVMSLPRQLNVDERGELISYPVPEMEALRGKKLHTGQRVLRPGDANLLGEVQGRALEILARFDLPEDAVFDLDLCCSADGREFTRLRCDAAGQALILDRAHSSLSGSVGKDERCMPLTAPQKVLTLHIYLDHSVIEVNVNGRAFLTSRVYPQLEDSTGLRLSVRKGVLDVLGLDIWEMSSIWEE